MYEIPEWIIKYIFWEGMETESPQELSPAQEAKGPKEGSAKVEGPLPEGQVNLLENAAPSPVGLEVVASAKSVGNDEEARKLYKELKAFGSMDLDKNI